MERHLKRIRLDEEERVGLVERRVDLHPRRRVDLLLEVEAPQEAAAGDQKLILRERLAQARPLAVTERRHALHHGIDRQRGPVRRPAGFEPALWTEILRIGIFDRVAEERPVLGGKRRALLGCILDCVRK